MKLRKPKNYWCHPFPGITAKHKWRYGHQDDGDKKYVCSNCGLQRNTLKNVSDKER